eukprot:TRINITY_DN6654_c0_g1_i1.p1 TRINITY_DN6654_c0_g1~~TRINITY_DN6654_c0_g1_i1.p1  ORF type:complete len:312 (+),score=37.46 TRINITY_DN6654_c0_g1_i1:154-1089(+)
MLRLNSTNGIIWIAFIGLFGFFCLYTANTISSLQYQIKQLSNNVEDLEDFDLEIAAEFAGETKTNKRMLNLRKRVKKLENKVGKLFDLVDPWEKCLRFRWTARCPDENQRNETGLPCSSDILREMTFAVTEALEKRNFTHWISYGTLLGAARDQKIIPWTQDADIVIHGSQFKFLEKQIIPELHRMGFSFFYDKKAPDIGRVCVTNATKFKQYEIHTEDTRSPYYNYFPYMDIYQTDLKAEPDAIVVKYGPKCRFKPDIIFPLSKIQLYDRFLSAPANTDAYLTQIYGVNYTQPPPKRHAHGVYSESCKNG